MTEVPRGREAPLPPGRLLWGLPAVIVAVLAAGILYGVKQEMLHDRAAHEGCRMQANNIVQAAVCSCILEHEDGFWQHVLVMLAPVGWRDLWHRATENECRATAYAQIVAQRGVNAGHLLSVP